MRSDFEPGSVEPVLSRLADLEGERVQAAVVLLAEGHWPTFERQVTLAGTDWRDVLVAAGLGDDDWQECLNEQLGPSQAS